MLIMLDAQGAVVATCTCLYAVGLWCKLQDSFVTQPSRALRKLPHALADSKDCVVLRVLYVAASGSHLADVHLSCLCLVLCWKLEVVQQGMFPPVYKWSQGFFRMLLDHPAVSEQTSA